MFVDYNFNPEHISLQMNYFLVHRRISLVMYIKICPAFTFLFQQQILIELPSTHTRQWEGGDPCLQGTYHVVGECKTHDLWCAHYMST